MVCIMCHSIIRAVNDDNEGRSFPATHTDPKIQIVIKYYFYFFTVQDFFGSHNIMEVQINFWQFLNGLFYFWSMFGSITL